MTFKEIQKFPRAYYHVDVGIDYLQTCLDNWDDRMMGSPLILNPEWQRGHVWTKKQQIDYMEYFLRGGTTGREIYFNCSSWGDGYDTPIYCLDGLQRITAALDFLDNKIKVFGHYYKEYTDTIRMTTTAFSFHMLKLTNKRELLETYIMFNSGGSIHKPKEIARIRAMQAETPEDATI